MSLLAVAQFAPGTDRAANLDDIAALAADAAGRGAGLIVLPEYSSWFAPDLGEAWLEGAEALDGAFVSGLTSLSRELGIHLIAGMLEHASERRVSNTVVAVSPSEGHVATYRKIHLYDAFGQRESDWVEPGDLDPPETFEWDGLVVGLQTCYDLRFPEVTRRLVDAGADIVAVPSEWVRGPLKEHHWRTLITARALENTLYLAASDHTPPIGVGNSMIVDPMGVELAGLGETRGIAVAEVSAERIAAVREVNPALTLRRL
ncbi:putative amidohydrolase [Microbacteriaceae bacterium SG_E_30_P1]|uniref:Amidohydrolase n=1 Tax=Antiquaquibacter oligotrophicus TaxID=2880260 RepID=A0ABT6KKE1_9MICO|nr:putative amidohydrolase [Antiquaquibacter oligotrophicus]